MTKSLFSYSLCLPLIFSIKFTFMLREVAFADSWKDLQNGDQAAQEFLNKLDQKKKEAGVSGVNSSFYGGISKEANLTHENLEGAARGLVHKDPASEMIYESSHTRPQLKMDVEHDPLIQRAQKILDNPLENIGGKGTYVTEIAQGGKDEILTCEEPGENYLESCTQNLKVTVIKTKVKKEWQGSLSFWMGQGAIKHGVYLACGALRDGIFSARQNDGNITSSYKACLQELGNKTSGGCVQLPSLNFPTNQIVSVHVVKGPPIQGGRRPQRIRYSLNCSGSIYDSYADKRSYYSCQPLIKIIYEEDSYQILPDEWISSCDRLEEKADQGLCSYVSKTCSIGKQTRLIEGVPITRDCWQETYTYNCSYPSKDNCGPLRARGCIQISSNCKDKVGNACVVYDQTYQCKRNEQTKYEITVGSAPFCLDGNCRDQGWENNDEMMSSIAQLALLKEMQGQAWNGTFFTGTDHQCSKYILNFKDCCGSEKGWGKSVGLAGDCKPKEKALSLKRKARLCHYVGTYCDKKDKITGKCIKKKSSFCCFGSKLLKAFHEQGRSQIGMGWGSAKEPLCRGFTIEEIQRIDFSKLDLSEVFEDLMKNYQPGKLQDIGQKVGDRLETIKKGMKPNSKQQPQQRKEA